MRGRCLLRLRWPDEFDVGAEGNALMRGYAGGGVRREAVGVNVSAIGGAEVFQFEVVIVKLAEAAVMRGNRGVFDDDVARFLAAHQPSRDWVRTSG